MHVLRDLRRPRPVERLPELRRRVRAAADPALTPHLEIETYTWDVLPDHLKTGDIVEYVTREIDWVKGQLVEVESKK